jgi:hypothetical protein
MGIRTCYEPEFRDMLAIEAEIAQEAMLNILGDSEESEANDVFFLYILLSDFIYFFLCFRRFFVADTPFVSLFARKLKYYRA